MRQFVQAAGGVAAATQLPGQAHTIVSVDELLNPYSLGNGLTEASGSGFVGREDVFEFVAQALRSEQRPPIVLYGQRRIGKSSVLRQLPRHLPPGTVSVVFDLQGQASLALDALLYGLARELSGPCGLPRPERNEISADSFVQFLDSAGMALGSLRRLVILFDEFDVVDVGAQMSATPATPATPTTQAIQPAAASFLGFLARLVEQRPGLGVVMVVGRKIAELSEAFVGAILRNAVQHRLARLSRAQSDALANGLGRGVLVFDDSATARLYALAAGHPYCTQLLCNLVWQLYVQPEKWALPVRVRADQVQAALAPAVEHGTSGLSWIYDGLEIPSHRLFLGALAELHGELPDQPVTMVQIEQRLFRHSTLIDAAELRTAPARLANWDVVDRWSDGYRFAVPIFGDWIRLNRPLAELEAQTQLVNPRAWRFYELAALSQQREEWPAAIDLYRQALAANPALIEAQLGLGACLRARDGDGDLAAAIEAYQRALDLDPNAPRGALLEALGTQVDRNSHDAVLQIPAYRRIVALEPDGSTATQARRRLQHLAQLRLPLPKELVVAEALFKAIDDVEGLQAVALQQALQQPYKQTEVHGLWLFFGGILLATGMGAAPLQRWLGTPQTTLDTAQAAVVAVAMAGSTLGIVAERRPAAWRMFALVMLIFAVVLVLYSRGLALPAAGFAGFVLGAILGAIVVPEIKIPAELQAPAKPDSNQPLADLALRAAGWLQRFAQRQEKKKP